MAIKVLLIDDTESLLEFYKFQLDTGLQGKVEVITAINGKDAFEKINLYNNEDNFLCVITDYEMNIMNGEEFINNLRCAWKDISIFLHTNTYIDQIVELSDKFKSDNVTVLGKDKSIVEVIIPWIQKQLDKVKA